MNANDLPALHLKPRAHTRLSRGHLWVFSNEIARVEGEPQPGDDVRIVDADGRHRGTATHNPHTLIAARVHSRQVDRLDAALLTRRLRRAADLRRSLYPERQCWRAAHSEGDWLPGLIVERLGSVAVIQILTVAMERRRGDVIAAVREALRPRAIFERSDSPLREIEGLPPRVEVIEGEVPDPLTVEDPPGVPLAISLHQGQKTGLYLDHHDNRLLMRPLAGGARVLDVFSYVGHWSACALAWGAQSVALIDSSAEALARAQANLAPLCKGEQSVQIVQGDAFENLRALDKERAEFDLIVLDPPAFAKSRRHLRDALRGYKDLNVHAMRLLAKGGHLFTASCSHHVGAQDFHDMLIQAARNAGREFAEAAPLRQAKDHPVLLGHPETLYLKGALLRRVR